MPTPAKIPLTDANPWDEHVRTWTGCCRCALADRRAEVVMFRGALPCLTLFIGEAPGKTENALGEPFVGPAGQLLDRIVEAALEGVPPDLLPTAPPRLGFANLIGCIPLDEDGDKVEAPPDDAVRACAPRLADLVRMAAPRLLVRVGKQAQEWLRPGMRDSVRVPFRGPVCDLFHPAWMLRKPDAFRDLEAHRAAVALRRALLKTLSGDPENVLDLSGDKDKIRHLAIAPLPFSGEPDEIPF